MRFNVPRGLRNQYVAGIVVGIKPVSKQGTSLPYASEASSSYAKAVNLRVNYSRTTSSSASPPSSPYSEVIGSMSVMVSSSCYGWITPILSSLLTPEGAIPITEAQAPLVTAIIEVGHIVSPIPAGYVCNYVGRKPVLLASAPAYILGWLLILFYRTFWMLIVARFIQGLAMGFAFTAVPVYLGEIASNTARGSLSSLKFNAWWLGFLIQYVAGPLINDFTSYTVFTMMLNVPFFLLFLFQPETPYYYLMAGDDDRAEKALRWFRDGSAEQIKEEMEEIKSSVEVNKRSAKVVDIVGTPGERKAFTVMMVISVMRILSGAGALFVWATRMFNMTSGLAFSANKVTMVLGLVMFCGGLFSSVTSDILGRRPLLLISSFGAFLCNVIMAVFYYLMFQTSCKVSSFSWLSPVTVCVYMGLCSAGMYPVASAYTSELFPTNIRGVSAAISSLVVAFGAFFAMLTFPILTNEFGLYINFALYALISLLGSAYLYINAPETKGKSFSQIRKDFLAD